MGQLHRLLLLVLSLLQPHCLPAEMGQRRCFRATLCASAAEHACQIYLLAEPWKAPVQDQRKTSVRVAGDGRADEAGVYSKPMFDFAERRAICLEGMKKAYAVGLYGDDPRVIDGTWRELFPGNAEGPAEG
jgi:hypothetical protein